jgi:hypothetical protein
MKLLKFTALAVLCFYLAIVALFFSLQRKMLYFPERNYTPLAEAEANPALSEIAVHTADGLELKAWYAKATTQTITIVFFHGNGDSLLSAAPTADAYIGAGYGFVVAEYRGYSGLPGSPTEAGLYEDGRALVSELSARGVASRDIVFFGHSLGTGVAVEMAKEFPSAGLMLLAPYQSIPAVAKTRFPLLPVSLIALDRYESEKKIAAIHAPVLVVNGDQDKVIPPAQGRKLFSLANEPKEFHSLPGHGHNDSFGDFIPLSLTWLQRNCHAG